MASREAGSSPLTRGKLHGIREPLALAGLIPAHAGKTVLAARRPPPPKAHPRSRGENVPSSPSKRASRGSSPLTRGKRRTR